MSRSFNTIALPDELQMERLVENGRDDVMNRLWSDFNFSPKTFANHYRIRGRSPYLIRIAEALRGHSGSSHIADIDCAAVHYGYRAAMRASTVVNNSASPAMELFKQATGSVLSRTVLTEATDAYLETRPTLEGVLYEVALSIAPDERAIQDIRTAGGLGFLLMDMNEERRYADSLFSTLLAGDTTLLADNPDKYY
ncbi:MAG: hypothetical protein WBP26_01500 [Candidatus Saccharimonadales bacterium]